VIKAVLFDFDGTLINTNDLIINSFKYALKKVDNANVPSEKIVKTFGEPLRMCLSDLSDSNLDELMKEFREYNESNHDEMVKEFKGVKEGLVELKRMGMKLGIVTSKRKIMAKRGLKLIGIEKYIDVIITSEDTEKHKPLGDPALIACELLNVMPGEAVMVGDSHNDILCGKNAGCFTALVNYTLLPMEDLIKLKPNYIINSILELSEMLEDNEKVINS
jgi:pyrophosphatase PpaX